MVERTGETFNRKLTERPVSISMFHACSIITLECNPIVSLIDSIRRNLIIWDVKAAIWAMSWKENNLSDTSPEGS